MVRDRCAKLNIELVFSMRDWLQLIFFNCCNSSITEGCALKFHLAIKRELGVLLDMYEYLFDRRHGLHA